MNYCNPNCHWFGKEGVCSCTGKVECICPEGLVTSYPYGIRRITIFHKNGYYTCYARFTTNVIRKIYTEVFVRNAPYDICKLFEMAIDEYIENPNLNTEIGE